MAGKRLAIRIDASPRIGSGHAMRCMAVARSVIELGGEAVFVVSNDESARFVRARGWECIELGGNPTRLLDVDAFRLLDLCSGGFDSLLVDTYAATEAFFKELLDGPPCRTAWIDDMYGFEGGISSEPIRRGFDLVVNYGFFADEEEYQSAYRGTETKILLGPSYAPLRGEFSGIHYEPGGEVRRVLITSGSSNPNRTLERLIKGCSEALPEALYVVVVGSLAEFDVSMTDGLDCQVRRDVRNMADLMAECDLCLSAAGSTLYELSSIGVPTVAFPIVENQLKNARGFAGRGLGLIADGIGWDEGEVSRLVGSFTYAQRKACSDRMRSMVKGNGAGMIAAALI